MSYNVWECGITADTDSKTEENILETLSSTTV